MDTGELWNKEMVDLVMKIKWYLKSSHNIVMTMSDKDVLAQLLDFAKFEDTLFQGMLEYFMVLAGGDWNKRYSQMTNSASNSNALQGFARNVKASVLLHEPKPGAQLSVENNTKARYCRGQPV